MNQLLKCLIFLAFVSSAISLDFGRFLGFQREAREDEPPKDPEIPEVVETVRWRQSVCVVPGPNVPPCFTSLKKYQSEHDKNSERRIDENSEESKSEEKRDRKTARALSLDRDEHDVSRIITPKVMRLMEIENSPSDQVQSSNNEENLHLNIRSATPGLEVAYGRRQGKYLIIATASPTASPSTPPPAISVTKVLNSPVTATLVAKNCFPDIGVPLCNDYQETLTIYKKPKLDRKRDWVEKNHRHREHHSHHHEHHQRERDSQRDENEDSFLHNSQMLLDRIKGMSSAPFPSSQHDPMIITQTQLKPQVMTVVESHKIEETSTTPKPNRIPVFPSLFPMDLFEKRNNTNRPGLQQVVTQSIQTAGSLLFGSAQETAVQAVQGVLNRSQVVVADKDPETQSVVVLESTQKPGFFANVWGPGSFNIFNKITIYDSTTNKPTNYDNENVQSESSPSSNLDKPEETKVTEFLDNPQSDHSVTSSQDALTTITNDGNGNVAQLDQPSGTFDELVDNLTESSNKTDKNEKGSLLVENSLLLNSQNKPLVVERPGQLPLLVERPIYVSEKPALASLFNFVRPSDDQPLLNVNHEVIKDIVHVFVKPESLTVGLQAWFSIIKHELIKNKKNETASVEMENVEEVIADSTEEEPETIVKVSTTPGTISTVVENATTTEVPTVPEVVEVTAQIIDTSSEVETSTETERISTGKIIRKTPEVTTLPYAEETTTTIVENVDTVTTEVPTVPEVTEVGEDETSTETETISTVNIIRKTSEVTTLPYAEETTTMIIDIVETVTTEVPTVPEVTEVGEDETSTEPETISTGKIDRKTTPEVTTLPYAEETTTTIVENVETGKTEVLSVPEVTEVNVALEESNPEAAASKSQETNLPVAQQLVNTTPEDTTILEALEETTTTEISTGVTEKEYTEATEISTYPEVAEESSTTPHDVSESRRLKKREASLPIIDEILTSLKKNWTMPEDVDLFDPESEFIPELEFSEDPQTTQSGSEETTTGAPETFIMSEIVEISAEGSGYSVEVEFSRSTGTEDVDIPEETETTTMTAEEIDTPTPEVSTIPEDSTTQETPWTLVDETVNTTQETTIIPEIVRATDNEMENVPQLENSESAENQTSQEADEVSEENIDSMEKRDIQTTAVPTVPADVEETTDEKTESIPQIEVSTTPRTSLTSNQRFQSISADIVERLQIFAEYEKNHALNSRREVSMPEKRDDETVEVSTVPEYMLRAEEIVAHFENMKEPEQPAWQKPYIKLPKGLESMEAVREYERTHVFVPGFGMSQLPQETTTVFKEVETTTQSVQTVSEEIEKPEEKIEFVADLYDSRNVTTTPTLIETHVTETTEFPMAPETIIVPEADEHPETSTIVDYEVVETTEIPSEDAKTREQQETSSTVIEKIVNHWTIETFQ